MAKQNTILWIIGIIILIIILSEAPIKFPFTIYPEKGVDCIDNIIYYWNFDNTHREYFAKGYEICSPYDESTSCEETGCYYGLSQGDINKDGIVGQFDQNAVLAHWGESCSAPSWCEGADVNHDGIVGQFDQNAVLAHWGKTGVCEAIQECSFPLGDINKDGIVGQFDQNAVLAHWGESCSAPSWCEGADVNHDGIVGQFDQNIVLASWGKTTECKTPILEYIAGKFNEAVSLTGDSYLKIIKTNAITTTIWIKDTGDANWIFIAKSGDTNYVNGEISSSRTIEEIYTENILGKGYLGLIDDFAIYSRELSENEIKSLYKEGRGEEVCVPFFEKEYDCYVIENNQCVPKTGYLFCSLRYAVPCSVGFNSVWSSSGDILADGVWDKSNNEDYLDVIEVNGDYVLRASGDLGIHKYDRTVIKDFVNPQETWGGTMSINLKNIIPYDSPTDIVFAGGYEDLTTSQRDFTIGTFRHDCGEYYGKNYIYFQAYEHSTSSGMKLSSQFIEIPETYIDILDPWPDRWVKINWFFTPGHYLYVKIDDQDWTKIEHLGADKIAFARFDVGWVSSYNGGNILIKDVSLYDESCLIFPFDNLEECQTHLVSPPSIYGGTRYYDDEEIVPPPLEEDEGLGLFSIYFGQEINLLGLKIKLSHMLVIIGGICLFFFLKREK